MMIPAVHAVLDALDYAGTDGLLVRGGGDVAPDRAYLWDEVQEKFSIDAAYFHGNIPVLYFRGFDAASDDELARLHRDLWNHNRVPLFVAVLPAEVRIYNCFATPTSPQQAETDMSLLAAVRLATNALETQEQLLPYRRDAVESGQLARETGRFQREERVDRRLLNNLGLIRAALLGAGLREAVVNSLIGRSIFVRYLEDRGVLTPAFMQQFGGGISYAGLLERSRVGTYRLFAFLAEKFNGDMFPVSAVEESSVMGEHLQLLGRFLSGADIATGQTYFWAYNFRYIPIELISSIYEEFLHAEREASGAYYTPPEIVDFVLNEVLPWGEAGARSVLDPACGSGIFLVEAYRRLVERERRARARRQLDVDVLRDILVASIHGVDINEEAVRVAAFSCYLALLDLMEPKSIWGELRFPTLIGANLFVSDFFDTEAPFNDQRFDVIVGNPPWQSVLSDPARHYLRHSERVVGDQQSAQAFLWRAPDLLAPGGRIGLLAPSKGILFNRSERNLAFRRQFFSAYAVSVVVDFSLFRRVLFQRARAPMAAIFYRVGADADVRDDIRYYTPHPSPLGESLNGIVIAGDEVKNLSRREVIAHPDLWKVALLGTARDFALIEDLRQRFPPLRAIVGERGWVTGQGAQVRGGDRNVRPEMAALRFVPTESLHPFRVTAAPDARIGTEVFHRPRDTRLYKAPHVLIRTGLLSGGIIASAFVPYDAVFLNGAYGVAGPAGDADLLKVLCAYLNSSLARYYHFLTGSSWGIERDKIELHEHLAFPFALPPDESSIGRLAAFVDAVQRSLVGSDWQGDLDALVFAVYGLTAAERDLVLDTVRMSIGMFYGGVGSSAFRAPSVDELMAYAQAFAGVVNNALAASPDTFAATVYRGDAPYRVVSFHLAQPEDPALGSPVQSYEGLDQALTGLDRAALKRSAERLYLRRNVKVFGTDAVHVMKPSERRYWTRTAAYNDADDTIAHLMRTAQLV